MVRVLTLTLSVTVACCMLNITATAKEPIHIGVFLPMTGNGAAYGRLIWAGIKTAHRMMNTVSGREVKLFLEDTQSDQAEAAGAVQRLIKEREVVSIIGGAISANALSGGAIAEENMVPLVSPSATNPRVTLGKKYVFRVCFDDLFQTRAAARQVRIAMNGNTAAVIVDIAQAEYSVELANLFLKALGEMGGKVLVTAYIQTGDRDFRSQLSEVLSAKPDIIYLPNYYTEDALLAKQARDLGMNIPILMADGAQVPELIEIGGKAVEEVYLTAHFNSEAVTTQLGRDFTENFTKDYNMEVSAFGALGADAYFILTDAMERAKSTKGPEVRAALVDTKVFAGVTGTISINEDGNAVKSLVINEVKNGRFTYVTTVNP